MADAIESTDSGDVSRAAPAAPRRRRGRSEVRRSELIAAAVRAIRQNGGRVPMEVIAGEAGISRPILYRHFGDATGLYAAVADRYCRDLLARLATHPVNAVPGREVLRRQTLLYLSFVAEDPHLYRFLAEQAPADRETGDRRRGFTRLLSDTTATFLTASGWPRPVALVAADVFVGGLGAVADRWVDAPAGSHEDLAERLTAVLWDGFESLVRRSGRVGAEP